MLPREKFLQRGIDSLSDSELIALLVGYGCKNVSFSEISGKILRILRRSLRENKKIGIEELSDIEGMGNVKAMKILAGIEIGKRIYSYNNEEKRTVRNSKDAYEYLKYMRNLKQENMVGIFLNARFEVLKKKTISIGSVDRTVVIPRDVIIPALEVNASSVILAHNHPSGVSKPSREDILLTRKIKGSLELVGIDLLEHIVIADDGWCGIEV
jgi:DNA repair protein RadC